MSGFYILAAIGAWKSRNSTLTLVVAGITIPFMGLIALTWAIWEGRFGWWFLVLWTMWAGVGFQTLIDSARRQIASPSQPSTCPEGSMPEFES
jgi:glucose dehydrogenase